MEGAMLDFRLILIDAYYSTATAVSFGMTVVAVKNSIIVCDKPNDIETSRQLVGKWLLVIWILSNCPQIKHFVSFSENPLYFQKLDV